MFRKKPTEFDAAQDKTLKELVTMVNVLWKGHEELVQAFNNNIKVQAEWNKLTQQLQAYLKQKDAVDKAQDEKINGFLNSLANLTKQTATTEQTTT